MRYKKHILAKVSLSLRSLLGFCLLSWICACSGNGAPFGYEFAPEPIEPTHQPSVTVSTDQIEFQQQGGSETVSVYSNTSWSAQSSDPSWLVVAVADGTGNNPSFTITARENTTESERLGHVVFTTTAASGNVSYTVTCRQAGKEPDPVAPETTLTVNPTSHEFAAEGGRQEFTVTSNADWSVLDGYASWIKVSVNGNTVTVSADPNESYSDSRNTSFTIQTSDKAKEQTVTVKQRPKEKAQPGEGDNQTPDY